MLRRQPDPLKFRDLTTVTRVYFGGSAYFSSYFLFYFDWSSQKCRLGHYLPLSGWFSYFGGRWQ